MPATPREDRASSVDIEGTVSRWLVDVVAKPHPRLPRSGAICPFVKPALRAAAIKYRTVNTSRSPDLAAMLAATARALDDFESLAWYDTPRQLQSLVVIFPDLDDESAMVLDEVHRSMKDVVVSRRLMFAQFHPRCAEASVRNPALTVGLAPAPVLVFRRLAVHDILFLEQRASWFAVFRECFGHRFRPPIGLEPTLVNAYLRAEKRFGGDRDRQA